MYNFSTAGIVDKGKILLNVTSEKTLALNNVLYVLFLCRNIVFGTLFNKAGLKIITSRGGDFVGKGYLSGGLFMLSIVQ